MAKSIYPTYSIPHVSKTPKNDLFIIEEFETYIQDNPHLDQVHNHSYFHFALFTQGKGKHLMDFENFEIRPGMIYFMRPEQMHKWYFEDKFKGFIVNFSTTFFDQIGIPSQIIDKFSFFEGNLQHQAFYLKKEQTKAFEAYFETILNEFRANKAHSSLMIASKMLEVFVEVERIFPKEKDLLANPKMNNNMIIYRNFKILIEQHFYTAKLPKEYAEMLYITPHHLNAVCNDIAGISSGEIIRQRIILEAKRLLVNFELSINQIASQLNFADSSYFVKFFKKNVALTPEQFRKKYYQDSLSL